MLEAVVYSHDCKQRNTIHSKASTNRYLWHRLYPQTFGTHISPNTVACLIFALTKFPTRDNLCPKYFPPLSLWLLLFFKKDNGGNLQRAIRMLKPQFISVALRQPCCVQLLLPCMVITPLPSNKIVCLQMHLRILLPPFQLMKRNDCIVALTEKDWFGFQAGLTCKKWENWGAFWTFIEDQEKAVWHRCFCNYDTLEKIHGDPQLSCCGHSCSNTYTMLCFKVNTLGLCVHIKQRVPPPQIDCGGISGWGLQDFVFSLSVGWWREDKEARMSSCIPSVLISTHPWVLEVCDNSSLTFRH